jgi:hypothetical protein
MVSTIRKQATSCTIGAVTFPEIMYYAYRPVGSGPGGAIVSPRYVANTVLPIGVMPHHLSFEVEVALDADESAGFYTTNYISVPGTVLSAFTVTETGLAAGVAKTRTVTFASAYVMNAQALKVEEEAEHQPFVVTILCLVAPAFGAWT